MTVECHGRDPTDTLVHRRTTCRLCQSSNLELVLQLAPSPPVDAYVAVTQLHEPQPAYPLDVFLCLSCGHAQLLDVVSPALLFGNYIYQTKSSPSLVDHFGRYADEVFVKASSPVGRLAVDVGSNDGTLLGFFRQHGMRVLGIDPAREIADRATAAGIETLPVFLTREVAEAVRSEYGRAALVTANNVFAHADDMGEMVDAVRMLLADDGVFVFEVSYLRDMIDGMVFDFIYHEHLCYHSVRPLRTFLRRHGAEMIDVERNSSKGGSLRCTAQLAGGPRPTTAAVEELTEQERQLGLDRQEIFTAFAIRIEAVKNGVMRHAEQIMGRKQSAAGYGASATSTVLIHHFGLGELLRFLVDDIPERQNRFSPGHHIPVLAADALYDRHPDHVFVLAWRFADTIMRRHQRYIHEGGHFIVPLPDIHVV
jgi:SAM-dependent methyltransferase